MFARRNDPLRELERTIGYRFRKRALLQAALTHPSFTFEVGALEQDNQRLEYLGDAVLGLLAAQHAFERHTDADEGLLTVLRSQIANGRALAEMARAIHLGTFLRMGKGEERAGGRDRDNMLADSMEALFGAAWLDGGLRASRKLFVKLVAPRLEAQSAAAWTGNPKGELQELAQRVYRAAPDYQRVAIEGPAHAPRYRVLVNVGTSSACGEGRTVRAAEAAAAAAWLAHIDRTPGKPSQGRARALNPIEPQIAE